MRSGANPSQILRSSISFTGSIRYYEGGGGKKGGSYARITEFKK